MGYLRSKLKGMKKLLTLTLALSTLFVGAQSYTDCNGSTETISQWINAGTPVLVASKGFDCSICVNRAPMVGTWAANNPGVRVLGAMTYTYNSSSTPTCSMVNSWVSTHNWQGIFSFVDANREFFASGTPRYYVYEPISGMEVYNGFSFNQATQVALSYVNSVSIEEVSNTIEVSLNNGNVMVTGLNKPEDYRVLELTGKIISKGQLMGADNEIISMDGVRAGVYLIQIGQELRKVILN